MDAKVLIDKRETASQAGRRGFDPRLPLHVFNELEVFEVVSVTAIKRLSPTHPHFVVDLVRRQLLDEQRLGTSCRAFADTAVPKG